MSAHTGLGENDPALATTSPHLLVVDDDPRLRDLLRQYLVGNGCHVMVAGDTQEARQLIESFAFDLMILDVMLPGETGVAFLGDLRRVSGMPVLLLTALDGVDDRLKGLEVGADDYLAKPFEPRELLLRIRTILKRANAAAIKPAGAPVVRFGDLVFEPDRQALRRGAELVHLTQAEAVLLRIFVENPGVTLSREDLLAMGLAGGIAPGQERSIDVQVTRLRRKIEPDPRFPRYLHTVRGRGYVLEPDR